MSREVLGSRLPLPLTGEKLVGWAWQPNRPASLGGLTASLLPETCSELPQDNLDNVTPVCSLWRSMFRKVRQPATGERSWSVDEKMGTKRSCGVALSRPQWLLLGRLLGPPLVDGAVQEISNIPFGQQVSIVPPAQLVYRFAAVRDTSSRPTGETGMADPSGQACFHFWLLAGSVGLNSRLRDSSASCRELDSSAGSQDALASIDCALDWLGTGWS